MVRYYLCLWSLLAALRRLAALSGAAAFFLNLPVSFAHEGHDHGDTARSALPTSAYPRVVAQSELYEIVGILKNDRLAVYLDHFATNEPVNDAQIQVTIGDREPIAAEATENNVYTVPFPALTGARSIEVIFSITAGSGDDLLVGSLALSQGSARSPPTSAVNTTASARWLASIPTPLRSPVALSLATFALGVLFGHFRRSGRRIPAMATGAAAVVVLVVLVAAAFSDDEHQHAGNAARTSDEAMSDAPRRLPDGTGFVAKPTQRLLEIRTVAAKPETVRPAVTLIGRVVGDPNRTSVVQSIHGGRVIPWTRGCHASASPSARARCWPRSIRICRSPIVPPSRRRPARSSS
jgi:membrane fusion protein, heavy metal efflux system